VAKKTPVVNEKILTWYDEYTGETITTLDIRRDWSRWQEFLEREKAFRFVAADGTSCSVRKEPRPSYGRDQTLDVWYAYRTLAKKRRRKPKGHGRAPFPEHLPRERVVCSVPEEERCCPDCGKEMRKIGTEVTERGHFVPAHFVVRSFEREKLACPAGHSVVTAKAPEALVRRCKYEPSAYAHVVVSKKSAMVVGPGLNFVVS